MAAHPMEWDKSLVTLLTLGLEIDSVLSGGFFRHVNYSAYTRSISALVVHFPISTYGDMTSSSSSFRPSYPSFVNPWDSPGGQCLSRCMIVRSCSIEAALLEVLGYFWAMSTTLLVFLLSPDGSAARLRYRMVEC